MTDSQIHLWEVDHPDRPWPSPLRTEPQGEHGYSAEEALAAMAEAGVDRAVVVPPSWVGENNATALEAAAAHPDRFAIMGRFDFTAPDAEERLAHWREQPSMLGIRLTFSQTPTRENLVDGSIDWFLKGCEQHQVPLMMFLPSTPQYAGTLAERYPGLTVILDHMALDIRADVSVVWDGLGAITDLARFPNVFVKVSSAPNYSAEAYPYADIHGHLRRLYDAYGPERLFWGSDVTRLRGSYTDCRRLFTDALDFLSDRDRELIMGEALSTVLRWPATS